MRVMRFLIFITISSLILGSLHYYVWIRLFRDPAWPQPWPRVGAVVLALLAVSVPAGLILFRRVLSTGRSLMVIPLVWLGASFLLLIAVAGLDLARLLGRAAAAFVVWWQGNTGPEDPTRRLAISRALAGTAALAAGGITAFAVREARGEVELREVPVRLERLPSALDGLIIAQVSDLHVGLTIGRAFVASVTEKLLSARADAIVVTGDLVDGTVEDLGALVEPLGRLSAR